MKLFTLLFKKGIDAFASVLKRSDASLKYLLSHPLKKEVAENFYEYNGYLHIDKVSWLAKELNILTDKSIIVDVGGETGVTAKLFRTYFPANNIWIFEPLSSNFRELQKKFDSLPNFKLVHNAVGSRIEKKK